MSYSVLCIWITYHNNILASLQAFSVKTPPKLPKLPTNVTVVIDIFELSRQVLAILNILSKAAWCPHSMVGGDSHCIYEHNHY